LISIFKKKKLVGEIYSSKAIIYEVLMQKWIQCHHHNKMINF